MKMMNIESDQPLYIHEAEYDRCCCEDRMPSAEFSRICTHLSSIGDTVMISVTEESVKFSTRGDIVFNLNSFTKASPLSSTVTISLSTQQPVMVEYKIAHHMGYVRPSPASGAPRLPLPPPRALPGRLQWQGSGMELIQFSSFAHSHL
ncbi:hypothetical protein RD792_013710 [Penstemon davidsonii]|nr:hypothetical protein RD792_013710 [Penstemon davidsonii]